MFESKELLKTLQERDKEIRMLKEVIEWQSVDESFEDTMKQYISYCEEENINPLRGECGKISTLNINTNI